MAKQIIELKYSIGDIVWSMQDNKAVESKVMNWTSNGNHGGVAIKGYFINPSVNGGNSVPETNLYPTKEELLKSL